MAGSERLGQVACAAITTAAAVRFPRERGLDNGKVRCGMSGVGEHGGSAGLAGVAGAEQRAGASLLVGGCGAMEANTIVGRVAVVLSDVQDSQAALRVSGRRCLSVGDIQVKQKCMSWRRRVRRPHVDASHTIDKSETSGTHECLCTRVGQSVGIHLHQVRHGTHIHILWGAVNSTHSAQDITWSDHCMAKVTARHALSRNKRGRPGRCWALPDIATDSSSVHGNTLSSASIVHFSLNVHDPSCEAFLDFAAAVLAIRADQVNFVIVVMPLSGDPLWFDTFHM